MSDWAPGTKLRGLRIEIVLGGPNGTDIDHVGFGYEVMLPSGRTADRRGWTWHNTVEAQMIKEGTDVPLLGAEHRAAEEHLEQLVSALVPAIEGLMKLEGVEEIAPPVEYVEVRS